MGGMSCHWSRHFYIFIFGKLWWENEFNVFFISSPCLFTRPEIFRSFLWNVDSCDVWNVWMDGKREREGRRRREGERRGREGEKKEDSGREKREGGRSRYIRLFLFTLVCIFSTWSSWSIEGDIHSNVFKLFQWRYRARSGFSWSCDNATQHLPPLWAGLGMSVFV